MNWENRLDLRHDFAVRVEQGYQDNELVAALADNNPSNVVHALEDGADINMLYFGSTALHLAVLYDMPLMVELLLQEGADMNAQGDEHHKETPLQMAAGKPYILSIFNRFQLHPENVQREYIVVQDRPPAHAMN